MGEIDGEIQPTPTEARETPDLDERATPGPEQDSLKVPKQKRRRIKSPTPGSIRGRSMTPIRGRSQTPFTMYLTRRSATPTTWRSITPFLRRDEREKTPFELGKSIKTQLMCNKAVFDKALVMDITEPEVEPVRYITTDMSVIDRAAVMDVSNVEVIYVVEEYEEYEEYTEDEEKIDEEKVEEDSKKKKKKTKAKKERKAKEDSAEPSEGTPGPEESGGEEEKGKKTKSVKTKVKKEKKEKSPSPKLTLKLEIGGGPKASRKMFEEKPAPQSGPDKSKPPPKKAKSKLVLQMEEQAKAAAKAAEEAKKLEEEKAKQKKETYEERQKRLKAEEEERKRQEEEEARLKAEEEARLKAEKEEAAEENEERESGEEEGEGDESDEEEGGSSYMAGDQTEHEDEEESEEEDQEENDRFSEEPKRKITSPEEPFIRPDPEEEEKWKQIAEEEGEEFMKMMRKFSRAQAKSEKERDADWQKNREKVRIPVFINYLTDRASEVGHNVRLVCGVSGPDLSVKWFKDGKQVERDARHRINNNNNVISLEIVNSEIKDCGEYTCTISNVNDEVSSSCFVTIYEVFKDEPSPPTFTLIRDFYHLHDDELTIECHCHGIPRPKITWIKDQVEIKSNFKYTLLEEAHGVYKLMIYRPSAKDNGKYICRASNESGEEKISHNIEFVKQKNFHVHGLFHAHDPLQKEKEEAAKRAMDEAMKSKEAADKKHGIVGERRSHRFAAEEIVAPKNKLKFANYLRDRIALESATVKLACNVIGPNPTIRWLRDDNPIAWGPKVKNLSSENKAAIELIDVKSEISGVYKCIAKNQYSEIDTSCYLKVYNAQGEGDQQEPMFVLPMRDVFHSSENDLIIDTKVRGNPRPTITWLKDEMPVQIDTHIQQIEHLDGICELIINKPLQKDGGIYSCIAENNLGRQKISHTVVIENIPVSRRSSSNMSIADERENEVQQKKDVGKGGETKDQKGKPPLKGKKKVDEVSEGGRRRHAEPEPSLKDKIYFIAYLQNRYLAEGSKVKLQAVIGGPDPQIKWLKNGETFPYGPRIKNMSRESFAVLEINNANVDDSAEYTVVARNPANEITSSAQLVIYTPQISADLEPMFTRAVKEKYHLNINELILETHVRGQPSPIIVWVKDGFQLENGEKYQITNHPDGTSELVIDRPDNKDSGKYVVQAENKCGKTEIFHIVMFEGKESYIAENIHGVFHADRSLLKKEKIGIDEAESTKDENNAEGEKNKKSKTKGKPTKEEPVIVTEDSKPGKEKREKRIGVHFAAKLTDRVVAEGSKVKLTCYVDGPNPQIKWFKNENPVQYGPKVRQNFREGLCTLELLSASEQDSGTYKCYAKNNISETYTVCTITVYANPGSADVPPTFTRAIKDTYHGKINELVLDCHVRGLPTPTVAWLKDSVRIEPSEKYQQIDHDDGTCELIISNPIPYDSGKYVCQAENRVDKAEIAHLVQVQAKDIRQGSPSREPIIKKETLVEEKKDEKKEEDKKDEKKKKKTEESSGRRRHELQPLPDPKKKLYFGNFLANRTVIEGSNIRMGVYISGPDPQCRWFKNDQPIVYGPKSKAACQDGLAVLVLSNLNIDDSGEYKLIARNPDSEITTFCQLLVYEKVKEDKTAPVFTVGIKDNYYLSENELVLDCRVRGYPRPEIEWSKNNELIVPGEKYKQLDQANGYCKLIINEPTEKDSGVYSCIATNSIASDKISHTVEFGGREKFILSKTHGFFHRDPNKPHLLGHLGDHFITVGGTLILSAEFASTPSPIDVQWLRNKIPLTNQTNITTFNDHGVYTLAIEKSTPEIDGVYTCYASNAFGKLESHSNVHIVGTSAKGGGKSALFLSRPETEMLIAVNDPFSISFRVQGDPKPKLILMKGIKDITKSERVSKETSDDYIRFTVHNGQISDSGTYFVIARNEHGTDRIFTTVTIKNPKKK